jgi:hypothetical protein
MTALKFVTFLLFLSMVTARGASASPAPPSGCGVPARRELRIHIHLINGAGVVPRTLDDAKEEVARIWTPAGLRLRWMPPMSFEITDPGTVVVIVRRTLSRHSGVKSDGSRGVTDAALGWVLFDGDGNRGVVEVSLDAIIAVVMKGVLGGKSVPTLPRKTQMDLLGRGLGRVIAHEIGHWRMGRAHTRGGLMKPSLNAQDLIDWAAPPLPRGWTAGECEGRP